MEKSAGATKKWADCSRMSPRWHRPASESRRKESRNATEIACRFRSTGVAIEEGNENVVFMMSPK
jgi:hypothetical protein